MLGLPKRTAIPALHLLTGELPINYTVDKLSLCFLHGLIMSEGATREVILRQYATKTTTSNSLINHFKEKLQEYDLPTILDLLLSPPSKDAWKRSVKTAIVEKAKNDIETTSLEKSTLQFLSKKFQYKEAQSCILAVGNPRQVGRSVC